MQALTKRSWGYTGHPGRHVSVSVLATSSDLTKGTQWRDLGRPGLKNWSTIRLTSSKPSRSHLENPTINR